VFKQTVDYYINKGSHVFACFVDVRKAFDNVITIRSTGITESYS